MIFFFSFRFILVRSSCRINFESDLPRGSRKWNGNTQKEKETKLDEIQSDGAELLNKDYRRLMSFVGKKRFLLKVISERCVCSCVLACVREVVCAVD